MTGFAAWREDEFNDWNKNVRRRWWGKAACGH